MSSNEDQVYYLHFLTDTDEGQASLIGTQEASRPEVERLREADEDYEHDMLAVLSSNLSDIVDDIEAGIVKHGDTFDITVRVVQQGAGRTKRGKTKLRKRSSA